MRRVGRRVRAFSLRMVQRVLLVQVQLWKTEGLLVSMPAFHAQPGKC